MPFGQSSRKGFNDRLKIVKRFTPLLVLMLAFGTFLLFLNRHEARYPDRAADGAAWDREWTILGSVLGVETPGNGLTLLDNNTALTYQDLYYAAWAIGESGAYVNEENDEVDLYPAQLYLLLQGCKDAENARLAIDEWSSFQQKNYTILEEKTETYNGQEYTVYVYETDSDTNPYARGVSAFAIYDHYALSAELSCQDSFYGDAEIILAEFLEGCHFNANLNE